MDVSSVLSKRSDLPTDITIKPDMTSVAQCTEVLLLKERWLLTQQGVDENDIS